MRRLAFQMFTTVDGFLEGPNQDISWHNVDENFNDIAIANLDTLDAIMFGRTTYEGMAGY